MERRTALKLIAGGVFVEGGPSPLVTIAQAQPAYQLQFFSPAQNELLDRLTEMIIPADDHSPGAHQAQVSYFIDSLAARADRNVKQRWTAGLAAVEAEAGKRFQRRFLECSTEQQDQVMAVMAANEGQPANDLECFFGRLKSATIDGYYTSAVGIHKELQYKGNTAMAEFAGCTHPEHG